MDEKTREALEASIKHWEENVAAVTADDVRLGPDYCALCQLFHEDDCIGCPISLKTRDDFCGGTPYNKVSNLLYDWRDEDCSRDDFRAAAQAELDFLISLRPED